MTRKRPWSLLLLGVLAAAAYRMRDSMMFHPQLLSRSVKVVAGSTLWPPVTGPGSSYYEWISDTKVFRLAGFDKDPAIYDVYSHKSTPLPALEALMQLGREPSKLSPKAISLLSSEQWQRATTRRIEAWDLSPDGKRLIWTVSWHHDVRIADLDGSNFELERLPGGDRQIALLGWEADSQHWDEQDVDYDSSGPKGSNTISGQVGIANSAAMETGSRQHEFIELSDLEGRGRGGPGTIALIKRNSGSYVTSGSSNVLDFFGGDIPLAVTVNHRCDRLAWLNMESWSPPLAGFLRHFWPYYGRPRYSYHLWVANSDGSDAHELGAIAETKGRGRPNTIEFLPFGDWLNRAHSPVEPLLEWLVFRIPHSSEWNLSADELIALVNFAENPMKFTLNPMVPYNQLELRAKPLSEELNTLQVACPKCEVDGVGIVDKNLNPAYARLLKHWSDDSNLQSVPAVFWLVPITMLVLGIVIMPLGSGYVSIITLAIGLALQLFAIAIGLFIFSFYGLARSERKLQMTAERDPQFRKAGVFRGRYHSNWEAPYFDWQLEEGSESRRCELLVAREELWSWLSEALPDDSAVIAREWSEFELEFRGTYVGVGHFGHMGGNRHLLEIEEIISSKLVRTSRTDAWSELVRPSTAESPNGDDLLRTLDVENPDRHIDELLHPADTGEDGDTESP